MEDIEIPRIFMVDHPPSPVQSHLPISGGRHFISTSTGHDRLEIGHHAELQAEDSETCEVSFYAEGAFNKLYLVRTSYRQLLMRVSLPVYPHSKTRGEVTTLRFLRCVTDVPVPEVIVFDDSGNNEIGFEMDPDGANGGCLSM